MRDLIYLDHNATTPLDERVFEAMRPYFLTEYGNAASRQHALGRQAFEAVEQARRDLASVLHADPREIIWTSGATEANNLAIKGAAGAPAYKKRRHIVTVRTEHKAVLDPCTTLEEAGHAITRLAVDRGGNLDLAELAAQLQDDTLLVSVMHANNEIGVLHPIAEIGALCKERGVLFHTDATQTVGKEPIDVGAMGIDLLSLSAHKFHGPKGAGALYIRRRNPRVRCHPLQDGGGHEQGTRSGTLNVPGIVGIAAAATLSEALRAEEHPRIAKLRDDFEAALIARIPGTSVNGNRELRLANTTNLAFAGTDADSLQRRLPDLCISSSAACTSASLQPSYVLAALGADPETIAASLRFSLGRETTRQELERAAELIEHAVELERNDGPTSACG